MIFSGTGSSIPSEDAPSSSSNTTLTKTKADSSSTSDITTAKALVESETPADPLPLNIKAKKDKSDSIKKSKKKQSDSKSKEKDSSSKKLSGVDKSSPLADGLSPVKSEQKVVDPKEGENLDGEGKRCLYLFFFLNYEYLISYTRYRSGGF